MPRPAKQLPPRPCDRCAEPSTRLYRVVVERDSPWIFICDRCYTAASKDNPHYRYGGTWTARKR